MSMNELPVPLTLEERLVRLEKQSVAPLARHSTVGSVEVGIAFPNRPSKTLVDGGTFAARTLDVVYPLPYVTASNHRWPDTLRLADGAGPDPEQVVHDGSFWFEQPIVGQPHYWLVSLDLRSKAVDTEGVLIVHLTEVASPAFIDVSVPVASGVGPDAEQVTLISVPREETLRPPFGTGNGYTIQVEWRHSAGTNSLPLFVWGVTLVYGPT